MFVAKRPGWFILLVGVLVVWGLAGCAAFASQILMDPPGDEWDRAYFAALPVWLTWVYAVAVGAGLSGSIALLLRSRLAGPLYWMSMIAVLVQFGYVFFATDLVAHKGAAVAVPFPAFIIAMAALQIRLARYARDHSWVG